MEKQRKTVVLAAVTMVLISCIAFAAWGADQEPYTVIAWNDLGMHCMDRDYSVFGILPPYNNLHAQIIDRTTGRLVTSGVTLTYEAVQDTRGSINTTSYRKTNFWDWVLFLFGVRLKPNVGLAGNPVQGVRPAPMTYDSASGFWKAEGIPTVPYDDEGVTNYYPMVRVVARDLRGNILAETRTVLPVSDEMSCVRCHASNTGDPAAQPSGGWVNDPNPERDWKRNILRIHDDRNLGKPLYAKSLSANRYRRAGLAATADAGHPVLCANCHASNALGKPGVAGIRPLTASVHSWHAVKAMDDNTGMPLGQSMDRSACYYCHPGSVTQCLRGVMGAAKDARGNLLLQCQSCHGTMEMVGSSARVGWKDLPSCQYCHYRSADGYVRDSTVFDSSGKMRRAESIFGTGAGLYKVSSGHGGVQCEACHGPTHAEYPSSEPNDNVQSLLLQGYQGTIVECSVCHLFDPLTGDRGPHGLHSIGQDWVDVHGAYVRRDVVSCATCHGADYRGSFLSRASTARTFRLTGRKRITYSQGRAVGCYECHASFRVERGPGGSMRVSFRTGLR